jgi:hypothetical protein
MTDKHTLPIVTDVADGFPLVALEQPDHERLLTLELHTENGDDYVLSLTELAARKLARLLSTPYE